MATFRKIHTTFWSDPFVESLTDKQKLFYLYLMSNDKTKQSGIYEISLRQIKFETGFSESEVRELLKFLIDNNKIKWSEQTNEIALGNWSKYNFSSSPKIVKCIQTELLEVKNTLLIKYVYPMDDVSILYPYTIDTLSQEEKEQEKEQEEEKEEVQEQPKGKDKMLQVYNAPDTPVIEDTDVDYMIDETDIELTRPMLERIIDKFLAIDGRFKFQSVMSEIDEDYGGFDNLIEMYLPNDTSAQMNWKKQLQQYKNGIYA
jgi:hypothetical protein